MGTMFVDPDSYDLPEWMYSRTVKIDFSLLEGRLVQLKKLLRPYRDSCGLWLQRGIDTGLSGGVFILIRGMQVPPDEVVRQVDTILEGTESSSVDERFLKIVLLTVPNIL